jgi:hypothetical protein
MPRPPRSCGASTTERSGSERTSSAAVPSRKVCRCLVARFSGSRSVNASPLASPCPTTWAGTSPDAAPSSSQRSPSAPAFTDGLMRSGALQGGDVGGREVGAGAVQTCGVAPPAEGVAGDVDADFHHQLGFHQRDVQRLPAAPPGGERPACPRMTAPPRSEQAGDRSTCRLGEGGGAADVLKAAFGVVPAEQQRAGNGQRAGDRADDRLARLADSSGRRRFGPATDCAGPDASTLTGCPPPTTATMASATSTAATAWARTRWGVWSASARAPTTP